MLSRNYNNKGVIPVVYCAAPTIQRYSGFVGSAGAAALQLYVPSFLYDRRIGW
jgi:hypothetical protein